MKYLIILAAVFFVAIQKAPAQQQIKIKEYARQCANALIAGDYATFSTFTYPKLLALFGGRERLIKVTEDAMAQLKEKGIAIKKAVIGNPGETYMAGNELHCLVAETLTLKINNGYLLAKSFLLAVSSDNGTTWYFIDTAGLTPAKLKQLFPDFNNNLVIPDPTQPVFTKDTI